MLRSLVTVQSREVEVRERERGGEARDRVRRDQELGRRQSWGNFLSLANICTFSMGERMAVR